MWPAIYKYNLFFMRIANEIRKNYERVIYDEQL